MTPDQYLDQIQNQLMKTLTEKKDAMPPGFNQKRFALNCITVIRDMMKDYKKREQLQTVDINSIVLCMIKGAYLGLDFLNGECYAIPYKGEMTFQTDYKGEIKVCKRFSDDPIKDIYAKVVREGDGAKAVPVSNQNDVEGMKKRGYKAVIVSESKKNVIIESRYYADVRKMLKEEQEKAKPLYDRFCEFVEKIEGRLDEEETVTAYSLADEIEGMENKDE